MPTCNSTIEIEYRSLNLDNRHVRVVIMVHKEETCLDPQHQFLPFREEISGFWSTKGKEQVRKAPQLVSSNDSRCRVRAKAFHLRQCRKLSAAQKGSVHFQNRTFLSLTRKFRHPLAIKSNALRANSNLKSFTIRSQARELTVKMRAPSSRPSTQTSANWRDSTEITTTRPFCPKRNVLLKMLKCWPLIQTFR